MADVRNWGFSGNASSLDRVTATSSIVEWTPNFTMRLCRWERTVLTESCSRAATSLHPAPSSRWNKHISLAWRESRQQLIATAAVVLIIDQQPQYLAEVRRWQPGLTTDDAADNVQEVVDGLFLPHPRHGACPDRGDDPLSFGTRTEHDDTGRGDTPCHLGAEGNARAIRESGVEQDHIGRSPGLHAAG